MQTEDQPKAAGEAELVEEGPAPAVEAAKANEGKADGEVKQGEAAEMVGEEPVAEVADEVAVKEVVRAIAGEGGDDADKDEEARRAYDAAEDYSRPSVSRRYEGTMEQALQAQKVPQVFERAAGEAGPKDPVVVSAAVGPEVMPRAGEPVIVARAGEDGGLRIRMDRIKQTMAGFGFSHAFWTAAAADHPNRSEIYDLLFRQLEPSIVRLRNVYEHDSDAQHADWEKDMRIDGEFVHEAKRIMGGRAPTIMLCSWSPPRRLKQNGRFNGGEAGSTLKKDHRGWFMYREWADWWVASYRAYQRIGVNADWISHQNEPDYNTEYHPVCLFNAVESFDTPSYYEAGKQLRKEINEKISPAIKMIGPESYGFEANGDRGDYLQEFPHAGGGVYSSIANHLYASEVPGFDGPKLGTQPDHFTGAMERKRQVAESKGIDVFMSEYAFLRDHQYQDPLRMAILIHHALTVADCTAYIHWDGFWVSGTGEGSLLLVDRPWERSTWRNEKGYTILHSFWWMMHFSKHIRAGFKRVQVDGIGVSGVLTTAWTGPNGEFVIIYINTSRNHKSVNMVDLPEWIGAQTNRIWYSTLDVGYTDGGGFNGTSVSLRPESITTVHSRK